MASAVFTLGIFVAAGEAHGFQNEPDGWEKAKLGASFEEIHKAYPQAKDVTPPLSTEAAPKDRPQFIRYLRLEDARALGLSPCRTNFSFVEDKLYRLDFDCGNTDAVEAALRKEFGAPSLEAPEQGIWWMSQKHTVTMNPRSRAFAFILRSLETKLQGVMVGGPTSDGGAPPPEAGTTQPAPGKPADAK
jgi:hypothetical protein